MPYTIRANPDEPLPTHHVKLTDGEEEIGLILCRADGAPDEMAFTMSSYPRQALKTSSGESKYADMEPPFFTFAQDDWSGGRASLDYDKDTSKYFDAWTADPRDGIILGGQATFAKSSNIATMYQITNIPASMSWQSLHMAGGGTYCRYMASLLDDGPSAVITATACELWVRKIGTPPDDLRVSMYNVSGGNPNSQLVTTTLAASTLTDVTSVFHRFVWSGTATAATYFVVVDGGANSTINDHWEVGVVTGTGKTATTWGSWTTGTTDLAYRITPTVGNYIGRFLNYKGSMYMYTQPDDGSESYLYRNGWRGAADSNAGQLTRLIDASQSWTSGRLIGAKVVIINGPGSEETQPWRTITNNGTNYVVVDPAWNIAQTTSTEYVIVDTDWWNLTSTGSLGEYVTGATVAGDRIYFCRGEDNVIYRFYEYNDLIVSMGWDENYLPENVYGRDVVATTDADGTRLWIASNENDTHDVCVAHARVPTNPGTADANNNDLYTDLGLLMETDTPWDARSVTNVTQSTNEGATRMTVGAGFTTGVVAVKNLPQPVDITRGNKLGMMIKSTVACADLSLKYDEDFNLGQNYAPTTVKYYDYNRRWLPTVKHRDTDSFWTCTVKKYERDRGWAPTVKLCDTTRQWLPTVKKFNTNDYWSPTSVKHYVAASSTWTTLTKTFDGGSATSESATVADADWIYIIASDVFDTIYVNMGSTVNAVTATMSAVEYFDGGAWTSVGGWSDGTLSSGKTLGKDGYMTFDLPNDWQPCTRDSVTGYMFRMSPSAALTASIDINEITVRLYTYETLTYGADGDNTTSEHLNMVNADWLYVIAPAKFDTVYFNLGTTVNAVPATMTMQYFNGKVWTDVESSFFTDGTNPSGTTLVQDGAMTFKPEADWAEGTIDEVDGYAVRISPNASLTADIDVNEIAVYLVVSYESFTNIADGTTATSDVISLTTSRYLYVIAPERFNSVYFNVGTPYNAQVASMTVEYYDGRQWASVVNLSDGTAISGPRTLAQDGSMTFTAEQDWEQSTIDGTTGYAVRLSPSAALSSSVEVVEVYVNLVESYVTLTNAANGDVELNEVMSLHDTDYLYIIANQRFDGVKFDLGTDKNTVTATMEVYYFDGYAWEGLHSTHNYTDGTLSSGKTLGQDGTMVFDLPSDWTQVTVDGATGYAVRMSPTASLTADIDVNEIYVRLEGKFVTWTNGADGDTTTTENVTISDLDWIYVIASERFDEVYWDLSSYNTIASTSLMQYWNGSSWTGVSNFGDGTASGGCTLGKDGSMTFLYPFDWEQVTVDGTTGYAVRISPTADLSSNRLVAEVYVVLLAMYKDLTLTYDGDANTKDNLTWVAGSYMFILGPEKFSKISVSLGPFNVLSSTLSATYWNGSAWTALTITDGTASGGATFYNISADITWTIPNDWAQCAVDGVTGYGIRLSVSSSLSTNIGIYSFSIARTNNTTITIPELSANQWTWVEMSISPLAYPPPGSGAIRSVGLYLGADLGAQVIDIKGGIHVLGSSVHYIQFPSDARINGLEVYAGSVENPISNPWVFTEKAVYEIKVEEDNLPVPLPLRELSAMSGYDNGLAHTTNGVYLYFNMGQRLENYYNRTLADIGPDRDEGMPSGRGATPSYLLSLPGMVGVAMDANTGTSSVLYYTGTAYHEAYRAPRANVRIRSLGVQPIPGKSMMRLWISMGRDILWIPFSLNPYQDTDYRYVHESTLVTGYYYAGMNDVWKLWAHMKLYLENATINAQYVTVDYQIDDETGWTEIGTFTETPVEEQDIGAAMPRARRIRFRYRLYTTSNTKTPRIKATTVEGVGFVPVKYQWAFTFSMDPELPDLQRGIDTRTPKQRSDTLKRWANKGYPIYMTSVSDLMNDMVVFVNPLALTPLRIVPETGYAKYVGKIVLIEV